MEKKPNLVNVVGFFFSLHRERVRLAYLESGHTSLRNDTTYEPHERRSEAEPLLHSS